MHCTAAKSTYVQFHGTGERNALLIMTNSTVQSSHYFYLCHVVELIRRHMHAHTHTCTHPHLPNGVSALSERVTEEESGVALEKDMR